MPLRCRPPVVALICTVGVVALPFGVAVAAVAAAVRPARVVGAGQGGGRAEAGQRLEGALCAELRRDDGGVAIRPLRAMGHDFSAADGLYGA